MKARVFKINDFCIRESGRRERICRKIKLFKDKMVGTAAEDHLDAVFGL